MTLKYESEVLFDLMKRDGDDAPSNVLPYESELKEKYLNQVVGAYPKLQDYRAEWLNYNLCQHLPSEFPVESVANVTSASFNNVVPYAYTSASLKGNTLVNALTTTSLSETSNGAEFTAPLLLPIKQILKPNTKYLLKYNIIKNTLTTGYFVLCNSEADNFSANTVMIMPNELGKKSTIIKTKETLPSYYCQRGYIHQPLEPVEGEIIEVSNIMVIEYQDGMENWNIPYFEGVQSVKMPVLTTTGKNLFTGELELGAIVSSTGGNTPSTDNVRCVGYIKVKPNTSIVLSNDLKYSNNLIYEYDSNKNYIGRKMTNPFTTSPNCHYIRFRSDAKQSNLDVKYQIEYGTQATSYEPYKTNILTVNEDVTLRGIGDVQDTLDLLTGEVTERIGEIVLDGTQDMSSDSNGVYIQVNDVKRFLDYTGKIACDKLPVMATYGDLANVENGISGYTNSGDYLGQNWLYVRINNSVNKDEVKEWLTQNPITVQYQLATESIKTVDLSCINEQGESVTFRPIEGTMRVNTSSQTLPPLLDMSVPVEATTQNLMSFANIEEEEK